MIPSNDHRPSPSSRTTWADDGGIEQLLTHFDRLIQTPESVQRLRRFILDLAVRGKLVPQDPADEPAAELLKRIGKEKARLVKEVKIPKQAPFQPLDPNEAPFDLPRSWAWAPSTYPSYFISDNGKKIQTKDVIKSGKFPVVDQGKVFIRGYHNDGRKVIHVKDPIILFGDHTRETKLIDFDFIVGADGVKLLQPVSIYQRYYFMALQWLPLDNRGYGRHFRLLKASFIPLPPLAEQHRIVAKVDELMGLCDRLEAARAERETTRTRLVTASLARLNAPAPDEATFREHVVFSLNNLAPLTTRPEQIKALRQTILNLAVRGKLVPQDPADEPVIVRSCNEMKNTGLPPNWRKQRLEELLTENTRNGYARKPDDAPDGVPILRISAGTARIDGLVSEEEHKLISGIGPDIRVKYSLVSGDLLACRFNGNRAFVGRMKLFKNYLGIQPIYPDKLIRVRIDPSRAISEFVQIASESDFVRQEVETFCSTTVGNWGISASNLKKVFFPLAPLPEQHRIVTKVNELMELCDRLEASLEDGDDGRGRLVGALLHKALEPHRNHPQLIVD